MRCPECGSPEVAQDGHDDTQSERQRYDGNGCRKRFDDLTDTIFAGHQQPPRVWVPCLYFMGPNLSNEQIAQEPGVDLDESRGEPLVGRPRPAKPLAGAAGATNLSQDREL